MAGRPWAHVRGGGSLSRPAPPVRAACPFRCAGLSRRSVTTFARVPDASLTTDIVVPPLVECYHFVNLTNGLEAIPHLTQLHLPYQFTRIQSTYCEQQRFDDLIVELDPGILMSMAMGQCCLVWDFGSRNKKRGVPRALWYGLEFIRYAASTIWLSKPADAYLRGHRVSKDFDDYIKNFSKTAKNKMKYYAKFVPPSVEEIQLYGVYDATDHDDDFHVYKTLAEKFLGPGVVPEGYIPADLAAYIEPRITEAMDVEQIAWGDPELGLRTIGFELFRGGVCHSAVQKSGYYDR